MYLGKSDSIRAGEGANRNVELTSLTCKDLRKTVAVRWGTSFWAGDCEIVGTGGEGYLGVGIADYCRTSVGAWPDRQRTASTEPSSTAIRPSPLAPPLGFSWSMASKA